MSLRTANYSLQNNFRRMQDLGTAWIAFNKLPSQTQSVPAHLLGYRPLTTAYCTGNTQNKKAQMQSDMFASLVLQSL